MKYLNFIILLFTGIGVSLPQMSGFSTVTLNLTVNVSDNVNNFADTISVV